MRTIEEKINHLKDIQRYCGNGRCNDGTPDKEILDEAIEAIKTIDPKRIHCSFTKENWKRLKRAAKLAATTFNESSDQTILLNYILDKEKEWKRRR